MLPTVCNNLLAFNTVSNPTYNFIHIAEVIIPKHRTSCREKSFLIRGPKIWNALPEGIRTTPTLNIFKRCLRCHLV